MNNKEYGYQPKGDGVLTDPPSGGSAVQPPTFVINDMFKEVHEFDVQLLKEKELYNPNMKTYDFVKTCLNDDFEKDHLCENCKYRPNLGYPCDDCIHDQAIGDYIGKSYWAPNTVTIVYHKERRS